MKLSVIKITGIAGVLLALCFICVFLFNSSSEKIFPKTKDVKYVYGTYHEDIDEKWSEVELDTVDHPFKMTYELSRATRNPFVAGFIARKEHVVSLANFTNHNALKINIKAKNGMRIPVMLTLEYPKGLKKKNGIDFPLITILKYIDYVEEGEYQIKFEDMIIPDWWYRVHRLHKDEVDLDKVVSVQGVVIGSCSILRENIQDSIEVNSIEFYTENSNLLYRITLLIGALLLLFLIIRGIRYS